ncbi:putative inorganic phosphate cotransporter [Microplitis mediator]|uniref:putative inorganic phosphate cotransporter n=1 Tax=Microplitis mediator TaxID=375433 RepID=UPI0025572725|nr:putative inorganic phosphate cotransporter [Microplitis mediator]
MSTNIKNMGIEEKIKKPGGLGARHLQCLLLFFGITIAYTNRLCLSLAIVAMKDSGNNNRVDQEHAGVVLSSFFWGYTVMQIPSGYLAREWSAKQVLGWGVLINGLLSLLVPLANDQGGWGATCACRVIMGLSQACLLPCVHTFLSKWVPPSERSRLGSITYAGAQFGTAISYPISGVLIEYVGWRSVFYFFGAAAIIWSSVFFIFGYDSPILLTQSDSKVCCRLRISSVEKNFIEGGLGQSQEDVSEKTSIKTPWISILTSVPFWALAVAHCGQNWGYWMLLTQLPTYMASVLKFNFKDNGLISALPYIAMLLLTIPVSWLSDWSQKKGLSRGLARKISNSVGHWGPGLALLGLAFVPEGHTTLSVAILIFAVGLNVGTLCGFQINHIDLSPNFAGVLMSITNCLASVVAILAPIIVGLIVTNESDILQWHTVFYISAAIYFIGNLIFVLFGKGEIQEWDDPNYGNKNGQIYSQ